MTAPVNVTSNVAGIGANPAPQSPDPLKIPEKDRKKYKKKNRDGFVKFISRSIVVK